MKAPMDMTNQKLREIIASVQSSGLAFGYQKELTEPDYSIERAAAEIMALMGADSKRLDRLEEMGLTTHDPYEGYADGERPRGIHSWQYSQGPKMWTTRFISSEFRTLREAIDAVPEREV